jgi:histidyl-tRNA synthetase
MLTQAPKGTKDILPGESYQWHYIEDTIRRICALYGYREIRTPVFEHTELFLRGVGDTTDIVQKEMYTFEDKGGRSITLKPEGTAGVVRSFVEHSLYAQSQPTKTYYLNSPVFRYENPQAGRLREHHQFGVEVFGASSASIDAEVINVALSLFKILGIRGLELNINSIGCKDCRPEYNKKLIAFLENNKKNLCKTCNERLYKNPLRILDCKEEKCSAIIKDAPLMINCLCGDCADHFESLKKHLETLDIVYKINPFIVRGLDYYTRTVFEVIAQGIGAQGTVCGGGRYDGLVEDIGGPAMQGIGFGLGLERLLLVLSSQGVMIEEPALYDVYICTRGEKASLYGFKLAHTLRDEGLKAECDHMERSMKAQFKYADKLKARYVLIIGDEELEKGVVKLRDMQSSEEKEILATEIILILK